MARSHTGSAGDLGLLALRMTAGGLMMGHGAQKLWGSFGGYGLEGTAGWMESMGLTPGKAWALLAGGGEFGSGLLMALGLFNPIGPLSVFGPMSVAWNKAHAGKPIWVTSGGAELPLTNMAIGLALALVGPGRYSLDEALDIEVPTPIVALTVAGIVAGALAASLQEPEPQPQTQDEAREELQSGEASHADEQAREVNA